MSAPNVTERAAVERERTAFVGGAVYGHERGCHSGGPVREAERRYPFPVAERPRVARDVEGDDWRIVKGEVECRIQGTSTWQSNMGDALADQLARSEEFRHEFAQVLLSPTEQYEDTGDPS